MKSLAYLNHIKNLILGATTGLCALKMAVILLRSYFEEDNFRAGIKKTKTLAAVAVTAVCLMAITTYFYRFFS